MNSKSCSFLFVFLLTFTFFMTSINALEPYQTYPLYDERLSFATYKDGQRLTSTDAFKNVSFNSPYTSLEGVLTFRGNEARTSPAYGYTTLQDAKLSSLWQFKTHSSSWGGGAGWTGQPVIIKWPSATQKTMNLYEPFKNSTHFVEVIYGSLSGHIYFLDLKTGKPSRPSIKIGNPIKGSVAVDPRGYPLLYVGEGVPEKGSIGYSIYSLIDGKQLYHINGIDQTAPRRWGAFDSSSLIHSASDTLITAGENGLIYFIKLHTKFDPSAKTISISPETYKYKYVLKGSNRLGIENSLVAYNNLLFFADNTGFIHCINIHTLQPVWIYDSGDDIDATLTLDIENGMPYLYTGNEIDHQGTSGTCHLRKLNGLTGEVIWENAYPCKSITGSHAVNGGLLATSVVGKHTLSDTVIFSIARYKHMNQGLMVALDKKTGENKWSKLFNNYMWSSPLDFYDKTGKGYLIQCDSAGNMFLLEGTTGKELHKINLGSNIEASPAFYKDYIVVAPRGNKIVGIKLQ